MPEFNEFVNVTNATDDVTVELDGNTATVTIGGGSTGGTLIVEAPAGTEAFRVDGVGAIVRAGSAGNAADLRLHDASDRETFNFQAGAAALRLGTEGNGGSGDIILRNGDLAEQFDIADGITATAGTVMVLADDGRLVPSSAACDRRVVGVAAGGGNYRSGIIMDHCCADSGTRLPIAMVGKASCRIDPHCGDIRVGDLLTSSPTPTATRRLTPTRPPI